MKEQELTNILMNVAAQWLDANCADENREMDINVAMNTVSSVFISAMLNMMNMLAQNNEDPKSTDSYKEFHNNILEAIEKTSFIKSVEIS
jgi:hypothetical protein